MLSKKNKTSHHTTRFEIYSKAIASKTAWFCHENRPRDKRNRINSTEIHPLTYSQLIFDKHAKNTQWGKNHLSRQYMVLEKLDIHMQKNEIGPLFHNIHTNQFKMDLRLKLNTRKL